MQENMIKMPMIGCNAPRFTANSTFGPLKLTDYMGKWLIILCHENDFTPVCTTEIMSFCNLNNEFKKRNCEILGINNNSLPSHIAWVKDIERSSGNIVPFPIISDSNEEISNMYGFNCNNRGNCECNNNIGNTTCIYIIDPSQKIRCVMMYPSNIGRNTNEILRMVDALQMADRDDVCTPANWTPGNDVIESSPQNYIELMERIKINNNNNSIDWYFNNDMRRW